MRRARRHLEVLRRLYILTPVEKAADVNVQGREYGNALHATPFGGSEEIIKLMVEKSADVDAQDGKYGNTLQAASEKNYEVVELLVKHGANFKYVIIIICILYFFKL